MVLRDIAESEGWKVWSFNIAGDRSGYVLKSPNRRPYWQGKPVTGFVVDGLIPPEIAQDGRQEIIEGWVKTHQTEFRQRMEAIAKGQKGIMIYNVQLCSSEDDAWSHLPDDLYAIVEGWKHG